MITNKFIFFRLHRFVILLITFGNICLGTTQVMKSPRQAKLFLAMDMIPWHKLQTVNTLLIN